MKNVTSSIFTLYLQIPRVKVFIRLHVVKYCLIRIASPKLVGLVFCRKKLRIVLDYKVEIPPWVAFLVKLFWLSYESNYP